MAKLVRLDIVTVLVPAVEDGIVQVALRDMLIVTNVHATMGAVRKFVRKPARDIPVHA